MLKITELLNEYNIPYANPGNTHYLEGWVNIQCPHCGSHKYLLGYNLRHGYFNCWQCGFHSEYDTLSKLLSLPNQSISAILKEHKGTPNPDLFRAEKKKADKCEFPYGTLPIIPKPHKQYLIKRGFSPDELEAKWGIKATGYQGNYAYRIIIPIEYNGELVSYQGRDVTGESKLRYKACPSAEEVIDHQSIVYGLDQAKQIGKDKCLLVEGVFDAWRMGYGAVSCFGITYTDSQIYLLANNFKKVYIMFDNEFNAQIQADKLGMELAFRGIEFEKISCNAKDPAELKQYEADKIMKELGFR